MHHHGIPSKRNSKPGVRPGNAGRKWRLRLRGVVGGRPARGDFDFGRRRAERRSPGRGTSTVVVTAADPVSGQTRSASLLLTVTTATSAPKISPSNLALGAGTGESIAGAFTPSGGTPPYTWSMAGGALPAGVTLGSDGSISGSASQAGKLHGDRSDDRRAGGQRNGPSHRQCSGACPRGAALGRGDSSLLGDFHGCGRHAALRVLRHWFAGGFLNFGRRRVDRHGRIAGRTLVPGSGRRQRRGVHIGRLFAHHAAGPGFHTGAFAGRWDRRRAVLADA